MKVMSFLLNMYRYTNRYKWSTVAHATGDSHLVPGTADRHQEVRREALPEVDQEGNRRIRREEGPSMDEVDVEAVAEGEEDARAHGSRASLRLCRR